MNFIFKNFLTAAFLIIGCFSLKAQSPCTPSIVTTANMVCPGYHATLTAFGASSYTWLSSNAFPLISQSLTVPAGSYTVIAESATCTAASATISIGTAQPLTINVSGSSQTLCPGGVATLTASGASSYTWTNGNNSYSGYTLAASPSVSTTYSVKGKTSVCSGSTAITITVDPTPLNIQVAASAQTVCAGKSVTLTASGASGYSWTDGNNGSAGATLAISPTISTTYTVFAGTLACHVFSVITIDVLYVPQLVVVTVASSRTICPGESFTITASGAYTYDWTDGINGYTGNPLVVSPTVSTTYSVTGNTIFCYGTAASSVTVLNCVTGIRQTEAVNTSISIFPNPGSGVFLVSAEKLLSGALLEVYDITGKLIHKMEFEKQNAWLHLESAPKGIYTVRLTTNGSPACYKRIVIN